MSGAPEPVSAAATPASGSLAGPLRAARSGSHWAQLMRFGTVGASGYLVNLAVYSLALSANVEYRAAATAAFAVALVNNFAWNRLWTFRDSRGHLGNQA